MKTSPSIISGEFIVTPARFCFIHSAALDRLLGPGVILTHGHGLQRITRAYRMTGEKAEYPAENVPDLAVATAERVNECRCPA
jgi:hypothetical protein